MEVRLLLPWAEACCHHQEVEGPYFVVGEVLVAFRSVAAWTAVALHRRVGPLRVALVVLDVQAAA